MTFVLATAEAHGTFHSQGEAIRDVLPRHGFTDPISVAVTSGSVENAEMLGKRDAQGALIASNWAPLARRGESPFSGPIDIRMAVPINAGPLFFAVRASSGFRTIDSLKGRRIAMGLADSGMARHVKGMLGALGWRDSDYVPAWLNMADGAAALAAGTVDAQIQPPLPNSHFDGLIKHTTIRAVVPDSGQMERILAAVPYYFPAVLKAGTFPGHDADVSTPAVLNVLVVGGSVSDATMTSFVKAYLAAVPALAAANPLFGSTAGVLEMARRAPTRVLSPGGMPVHPGARVAFKAAGYPLPG